VNSGKDLNANERRYIADILAVIVITIFMFALALTFSIGDEGVTNQNPFRSIESTAVTFSIFAAMLSLIWFSFRRIRETLLESAKRAKLEKDAIKSEYYYREILNSILEGMVSADADGNIVFCNPGFAEIFDLSKPETIVGRNLREIFPRDQFNLFMDQIENRGKSKSKQLEITITSTKGIEKRIQISVYSRYEDGEIAGLFALITDITRKKQAELALKESEEKFKGITERSYDLIFILDNLGKIVYLSPICGQITGFSAEELLGKSFRDIVYYKDLTLSLKLFAMVKQGHEVNTELKLWNKNKMPIDIELKAGPIYKGNRIVGVQGNIRDISAYKRAEEELTRHRDNLERLVEERSAEIISANAELKREIQERKAAEEQIANLAKFPDEDPDAVLRIASDGEILYSNAKGQPLLEYWQSGLGKTVPWEWQQYVKECLGDQQTREFFIEHEERSLSLRLVPCANAGYVNLYGRDITEQRKLEQQFLQAQKMESIGRLAGGVAHDFNNLLTAITGHAELIDMQMESSNPLRDNLSVIISAAGRAADLTGQLLAFSRKQTLSPKTIDLNETLQHLGKMLKRIIGEDITLRITAQEGLSMVRVDPGQIEQVIVNLSVNARDAMQGCGVLSMDLRNFEVDSTGNDEQLKLEAGSYVMLSIADTGSGMSDEIRDRIFEPFFTTKEAGKGTGLGLSTVYGIIMQSGGDILVESELGKGTTFRIVLPVSDGEVDKVPDKPSMENIGTGTETILVVEDDEIVRSFASQSLSRFGYHVWEAASGADALKICAGMGKSADLILSDVIMPKMNGVEFVKHIREVWPNAKALFMSGYTDKTIASKGIMELGAPFLQKPFHPIDLVNKVREILDSHEVKALNK